MDLTLAIGIVSCVIGVSTFVSGMIARSKNEGQTFEKINQCIKGIDEIKKDLKEHSNNYSNLHTLTVEQEARIRSLEENVKTLSEKFDRLQS